MSARTLTAVVLLLSVLAAHAAPAPVAVASAPAGLAPALGPPGLCHPIDIGDAPSLPWNAKDPAWGRLDGYDLAEHLVADTRRILAGTDDLLVHMETLRRAAVYLTQTPDDAKHQPPSIEALAGALADDLARTRAGKPGQAELGRAVFDLGYALAILDQGGPGSELGDGDAQLELACELLPDVAAAHLGRAIGDFDSWWGGDRRAALDKLLQLVDDADDPVARAAVSTLGPLYGADTYAGLAAEIRS